jgi:hypothetical protein
MTLYVSRMSENVGASTSQNPKGLHGLYRDSFTFTSNTNVCCVEFSIVQCLGQLNTYYVSEKVVALTPDTLES